MQRRRIPRLVLGLSIAVAIGAVQAQSKEDGLLRTAATAVIQTTRDGLRATYSGSEGEFLIQDKQSQVRFTAREITLKLLPDAGFKQREIEAFGGGYTLIETRGGCLTFEHGPGYAAPVLESGKDEVIATMASGSCGGCVTVWDRLGDNEQPWDGCPTYMPGAVCTYCVSYPCPDPEPEPPGPPPPGPDNECCWCGAICTCDPLCLMQQQQYMEIQMSDDRLQ